MLLRGERVRAEREVQAAHDAAADLEEEERGCMHGGRHNHTPLHLTKSPHRDTTRVHAAYTHTHAHNVRDVAGRHTRRSPIAGLNTTCTDHWGVIQYNDATAEPTSHTNRGTTTQTSTHVYRARVGPHQPHIPLIFSLGDKAQVQRLGSKCGWKYELHTKCAAAT